MLVAHKMDGLIKCHFMPLFIMENHIEMNDLGGFPILGNLQIGMFTG